MSDSSSSIAHAITEAARTIHTPRTLEDTLHAIVQAAQQSVPGFDHAGISVRHRDGTIETLAGSDELVWELDRKQYELRQGPCVEALEGERVVVVERAQHDQRWPDYIAYAAQAGLRAQLGLRLFIDENKTVGGLNLYSTAAETVDEDARQVAELFARHATMALDRAQQVDQLTEALHSRKVIGQAIGLLMARYDMDEDRAFDFLVRASSTGHIKLRTIAQELVDGANAGARGAE